MGTRQSTESNSVRHAYSVPMLAERWNRSVGNIYGMIRRGELRSFRVGKLIRILGSEVTRIESCFGELAPPPEIVARDSGTPDDARPVKAAQVQVFYSLQEAAAVLRIGAKTLRGKLSQLAVDTGEPLHACVGKKIIVSRTDLEKIYEALKQRRSAVAADVRPATSEHKLYARLRKLTDSKGKKK